jgi:hypothetical protein
MSCSWRLSVIPPTLCRQKTDFSLTRSVPEGHRGTAEGRRHVILGIDQPERDDRVAPAPVGGIPVADETAHLDGRLMHELSNVNYQLSRYVVRFLDADAGRGTSIPVADELALASCLETAAGAIRARAERRSRDSADSDSVEGEPR